MEKVYTLDNGNTNPHIGIFVNGKLMGINPFTVVPNDSTIISSCVGSKVNVDNSVDLRSYFKDGMFFDMPVNYSDELGDDRLFQAYYIYKECVNNDRIALIDSGTFLTIDIIDQNGFAGGYIYPGLRTMLKTYPAFSAKLPLVLALGESSKEKLGIETKDAISKACKNMFAHINDDFLNQLGVDKLIITGGSTTFIENNFTTTITAVDKNLIHKALYFCYQSTQPGKPLQ